MNSNQGKISVQYYRTQKILSMIAKTALKRVLDRLSEKRKIVSIFRGYYLIIPPQYLSKEFYHLPFSLTD